MTNRHQRPGAIPRGLALAALLLAALPLAAAATGADVWGGPAAKGSGVGARFDSNVYLSASADATGTVDFWVAGALVASIPFSVPANGTVAVPAPAALDGQGPFLWHAQSDAPVSAWSETFNDTPAGRFGLSVAGFAPSDFLRPGDEADGGGADASISTDPGRARTNVGFLCSPVGTDPCVADVSAFDGGTLLGTARLTVAPGAAAQRSLAALIPAAAERTLLTLSFRVLSGSGLPYAIRNDNLTSDASGLPLAVSRGAFSTAPTIDSFTLTPTSGCAPLSVTATWSTTGAARVTLSGVPGDLPPAGTATVTVLSTQDVVLTAIAPSGERTSKPIHLSVTPPVGPPAPLPATAVTSVGGSVTGSIPATIYPVTTSFDRQDSTGSTFTLNGTGWTYVAGTAAGTDVVRLTLKGPCGDLSSTFTVTVQPAGPPVITSFTADPMAGCNISNVVLTWSTQNAVKVTIPEVTAEHSFPPNGQTGVTITTATTFTLTAYNALGQKKSTSLSVPVDTQPYTPILDKNNLVVGSFTIFQVNVTGVPDPSLLRFVYAQNQSGSIFGATGNPGQFTYAVGTGTGNDVIRIFYTNGCGSAFTELHVTVM
jgi:hypothetical protein